MRIVWGFVSLGWVFGIGALWAQEPAPVGGAFLVSESATGHQVAHSVATDANGNSLVVWTSQNDAYVITGIYARLFDRDGRPLGPERRIDDQPDQNPGHYPAVTNTAYGDFIAVWRSTRESDANDVAFYARRLGPDGVPFLGSIRIEPETEPVERGWLGIGYFPTVTGTPDGFVVAWDEIFVNWEPTLTARSSIKARVFDATHRRLLPEFQVDEDATSDRLEALNANPSLASNGGGFVIVWQKSALADRTTSIFARPYDADALPRAGEYPVSEPVTGAQSVVPLYPRAAVGATDMTLVWQDPTQQRIFAQPLDADGLPIGLPVEVGDAGVDNDFALPKVATDSRGSYFVTWAHADAPDLFDNSPQFELLGRIVHPDGTQSESFKITDELAYPLPAVASAEDRGFIVSWTGGSASDADALARIYRSDTPPQMQVYPSPIVLDSYRGYRFPGYTWFAILGSNDLDVTAIDNSSVKIGSAAALFSYVSGDVDGDGDLDMEVWFLTSDASFPCGTSETELEAALTDGSLLQSSVSVLNDCALP